MSFDFNKKYLLAFRKLKEVLVSAPIFVTPDWMKPFVLMCDESDFVMGLC